jgi:hypothetical protein
LPQSIGSNGEVIGSNKVMGLGYAICIGFFILWSTYCFSLAPLTFPQNRPHAWLDQIMGSEGMVHDFVYVLAESPIPMPELFEGVDEVREENKNGHRAYLLGEIRQHGWWYFFPLVFAIKTPISFLILVLVGCMAQLRATLADKQWERMVPFLCAAAILLVCMPANMNIGLRHILPIYPLLAIVAGSGFIFLWELKWVRIGRLTALGLLSWNLAASILSYPDHLAYFNEFAQPNPERFVVDSDLDWGQDFLRLSRELRNRGVDNVALSIFSNMPAEILDLPSVRPLLPYQRTTGWIAISLMNMKNDFSQEDTSSNGYTWLEAYKPVTLVGKSIRLYHISDP